MSSLHNGLFSFCSPNQTFAGSHVAFATASILYSSVFKRLSLITYRSEHNIFSFFSNLYATHFFSYKRFQESALSFELKWLNMLSSRTQQKFYLENSRVLYYLYSVW